MMQHLTAITHHRFSLIRVRSPLLTESLLFSLPAGTEMFHFPASPPAPYDIQTRVTPHNGRRVPPFGNPRITARKPAPRGISQATASFIGPRCQGIHRTLKNQRTAHNTQQRISRRTQAPAPILSSLLKMFAYFYFLLVRLVR